jgi:hypothetical protein
MQKVKENPVTRLWGMTAWLAGILLGMSVGSVMLEAQSSTPSADPVPPTSRDTDRDLDLLDDLPPPRRKPETTPPPGSGESEVQGEDELLLSSNGGLSPDDHGDPEAMLRELSRLMQQVEQQLRQGDTSRETQQLQQQVIEQLDQWIAAFEQQQQQQERQQRQQESSASEESESLAETESPEEGEPSEDDSGEREETAGDPSEGGDPAEGEGREESRVAGEGEQGPVGRGGDSIWGHLPERIRQQLQSAAVERFHPKYEDLIEAFYQRLAEE